MCVTYRRGFVFDDQIYLHLIHSTWDYRQLERYLYFHALQFTFAHTHYGSQSSLVVSWQRIYNSITVTAAHMKPSLHSLIPFLPFLLKRLLLPTLSILIVAAWDPHYLASGRIHRKHRFPYCWVLIKFCRDVFTAQLRRNKRGWDPQRKPIATPLLFLRDVTTYVTRSSAACVRAITQQRLFLCLHSSCFERILHNIAYLHNNNNWSSIDRSNIKGYF
jgi:hypothetical protein